MLKDYKNTVPPAVRISDKPSEKQPGLDYALIVAVFILLTTGIVMVYSASSIVAAEDFGDANFFLKRHLIRVALGLILFAVALKIDYHFYQKISKIGLFFAIGLLLYVLIADAVSIKGATRWISVGGFTFQPSVFAQFALIFYMAEALVRKQDKLDDFFDGYLPLLIILCIVSVLILLEPDFSTTVIVTLLVFMMFFLGRVRIKHLAATCVAALPFFALAIATAPYRIKRLLSFLNPDADPSGSGYQLIQSKISLGNGGFLGVGIGHSKQKLHYLPEPFTDFIYAILGEELGFIGAIFVLFLFLIILWRGLTIAMNTSELYGKLVAAGITLSIVLTAFVNAGVVSGVLPTTGVPMPFISYGGTSLILTLTAIGVLLNISKSQTKNRNCKLIERYIRCGLEK
ncbi:putative lipid II flippase FtsW [candidate division KSB1 bacterium]